MKCNTCQNDLMGIITKDEKKALKTSTIVLLVLVCFTGIGIFISILYLILRTKTEKIEYYKCGRCQNEIKM